MSTCSLFSKTFVWDKTNNDRPFLAVNQLTAPGSLLAAGMFGFDNTLSRALLHAWMTQRHQCGHARRHSPTICLCEARYAGVCLESTSDPCDRRLLFSATRNLFAVFVSEPAHGNCHKRRDPRNRRAYSGVPLRVDGPPLSASVGPFAVLPDGGTARRRSAGPF